MAWHLIVQILRSLKDGWLNYKHQSILHRVFGVCSLELVGRGRGERGINRCPQKAKEKPGIPELNSLMCPGNYY